MRCIFTKKRKSLLAQLQPGSVLLLRLPWVCECNTATVVFETSSGEQSAPFSTVPLLIHRLAGLSCSHSNARVSFSFFPHVYRIVSYLSVHDVSKQIPSFEARIKVQLVSKACFSFENVCKGQLRCVFIVNVKLLYKVLLPFLWRPLKFSKKEM